MKIINRIKCLFNGHCYHWTISSKYPVVDEHGPFKSKEYYLMMREFVCCKCNYIKVDIIKLENIAFPPTYTTFRPKDKCDCRYSEEESKLISKRIGDVKRSE